MISVFVPKYLWPHVGLGAVMHPDSFVDFGAI